MEEFGVDQIDKSAEHRALAESWRERHKQLLQILDDAISDLISLDSGESLLPIKSEDRKNLIASIAYLLDTIDNARRYAEREDELDAFYKVRSELYGVLEELPEHVVLREGDTLNPQITAILRSGSRLRELVERLDKLDI